VADGPLSPDGGARPELTINAGRSTLNARDAIQLRFRGRVGELGDEERRALFDRSTSSDARVRERTAALVERVRRDGDAALVDMAREFDHVDLTAIEVPRAEWRAALEEVDAGLRRVMERTIANVRTVHAVASAATIYRTIAQLKALGGEGILVTRIERLMP
jgi:ATP phosphoribosyltransferase